MKTDPLVTTPRANSDTMRLVASSTAGERRSMFHRDTKPRFQTTSTVFNACSAVAAVVETASDRTPHLLPQISATGWRYGCDRRHYSCKHQASFRVDNRGRAEIRMPVKGRTGRIAQHIHC